MVSRLRPFVLLLLAFALLGAACAKAPGRNDSASTSLSPSGARPTIVFMTDFGTANDSVAVCKAVMVGIAPAARIMDITHQVTPYSIEEAARFLEAVSPYYPVGTVFVAVVDPGVGTSRKAIIVKSRKAQFFVLPDNGLITPVMDRDGLDSAREIANQGIAGDIIGLDDPFGSLLTDIPGDQFKQLGYNLGDKFRVEINKKSVTLPYVKTFMDVPVGDSLLFIDSRGRVSIAVNQGNYSKKFNVEPPGTIFIPRKGAPLKDR